MANGVWFARLDSGAAAGVVSAPSTVAGCGADTRGRGGGSAAGAGGASAITGGGPACGCDCTLAGGDVAGGEGTMLTAGETSKPDGRAVRGTMALGTGSGGGAVRYIKALATVRSNALLRQLMNL